MIFIDDLLTQHICDTCIVRQGLMVCYMGHLHYCWRLITNHILINLGWKKKWLI